MQKVYLLLRSNKQAGPYSLEELLQAELKPTDLVWVEGKSAAWSYPTEIKELQPYLQPAGNATEKQPVASATTTRHEIREEKNNPTNAKKIFVSLPQKGAVNTSQAATPATDPIEQKAEALRQKIQNYQSQAALPREEKPHQAGYTRVLQDVEQDYTHKSLKQKKSPKHILSSRYVSLAAIGLVMVGAFFIFKPSQTKQAGTDIQQPQFTTPVTETNTGHAEPAVTYEETTPLAEPEERKLSTGEQARKEISKVPAVVQQQTADTQPIVTSIADTPTNSEAEANQPEATQEEVVQQKEKRKSVGEAIDNFFGQFKSKKGKEEGSVSKQGSGERKATKRDEAATVPPDPAQLAAQVKVTASEPAENWMMGLKGIKLTLHNQSAYKLKTAVVEVAYYDEQNVLLEKKTVTFNNVPANKTVTMAAPDHRLASYAKHQLLSAGADEGSVAKQ